MKFNLESIIRILLKILPYFLYQKIKFIYKSREKPIVYRLIDYFNFELPNVGLSILDIGARFGFESSGLGGLARLKNLHLVGIEPDLAEARRLENPSIGRKYEKVYPVAIWDTAGHDKLYVTKCVGCTSRLEPNIQVLENLTIGHWFETVSTQTVMFNQLSDVLGKNDKFDIVKIDVQGGEWNVISSGKEIFNRAHAIVCEAHFVQIYKNQKTIDDLISLLRSMGFRLIKLEAGGNAFDGEIIEANCVFIKDQSHISSKEVLLKHLIVSALFSNIDYCESILRNCNGRFLSKSEQETLLQLLDVKLKGPRPIDSWNLEKFNQ